MNSSDVTIPNNTKVFFELQESLIHGYVAKISSTLAQGSCKILQIADQDNETVNDQKIYYISVGAFIEVIKNSTIFVRINYAQNTTYLFENSSSQLVSVSFNKEVSGLEKFENHFSNFSLVLDFNSENISPELKKKIEENCPEDIETKDVSNDFKSYVKKAGKSVGGIVGKVSEYVQGPSATASVMISERANNFTRDSIGDETKQKWNGVVEKSKAINEKLANTIRPAVNIYNKTADKIGQKFYSSDNYIIKSIREYSLALASSLNEGLAKSKTKVEEPATKEENSQMQLKE